MGLGKSTLKAKKIDFGSGFLCLKDAATHVGEFLKA
jgi:hypothetical protein